MAPPSGPVVARFEPVDEFQRLYRHYRDDHPGIVEAFHTFLRYKFERPPADLPRSMRDHHLPGDLCGFCECHLAADFLLMQPDNIHSY
jgi:mRNA-degrading endonuclease YafQ of YafQ-DinJ toxin-antitoxin module